MIFYADKFKEMRKKEHIPVKKITEKLNITGMTLWNWESGRILPSEDNVRKLSEITNIPLALISDLQEVDYSHSPTVPLSFPKNKNLYTDLIKSIVQIRKNAEQRNALLEALMNSNNIFFYIKDANLKYVAMNDLFRETLELFPDFNCTGKDDYALFSLNEARVNSAEDRNVIETGVAVENKERYLPGSKKKKICLVNKTPIYTEDKKIKGVAATFIDITTKVESEKRRMILETLMNNMNKGVVVLDKTKPAPRIIYLNKYFSDIMDIPATTEFDEVDYRTVLDKTFEHVVPEYREEYLKFMNNRAPSKYAQIKFLIKGEEHNLRLNTIQVPPYSIRFYTEMTENEEALLLRDLIRLHLQKTGIVFSIFDVKKNQCIYDSLPANKSCGIKCKRQKPANADIKIMTPLKYLCCVPDPVEYARKHRTYKYILKKGDKLIYIKGLREILDYYGHSYITITEESITKQEYGIISKDG